MKPSKEAIEAAALEMYSDYENEVPKILEAAYAIDVQPLEQRIAELEAENQRLEEQLAHFKDCYASLASLYDKAQLEGNNGSERSE